jgi:hypothetical protein
MRGGALPLLVWAALLTLLLAGNWVWTGDAIEVGEFGLAVLIVILWAFALAGANRSALHRGAPPPPREGHFESIPEISLAAALAPFAIASVLFGLAFGHFLIYFGGALFVLALARLAVELRASRRTRRRLETLPLPPDLRREEQH